MDTNSLSQCCRTLQQHSTILTTKKCLFVIIIGSIALYCFIILTNQWLIYKNDTISLSDNETLADFLYNEVRVLCWVMTSPENHEVKAKHVLKTWGHRCNKILFMSTAEDPDFSVIALPVPDGRDYLWGKTREAFKYVYEHHFDEYDWFLKVDDDTYVIVENLRYFLYAYSPKTPIYFGCKYKVFVNQGYMSGGAGYVLSKEALRRFYEFGVPNETLCWNGLLGDEDMLMGYCLQNLGIIAGDSRDSFGRGRFFPFIPETHLFPNEDNTTDYWYWKYIFYETDEGLDCCSDRAISFHYVTPHEMYVMDYLIYQLRPFGVKSQDKLPDKLSYKEQIKV